MVDLPSVDRRLVTSEAPRNRITPADIARPSQMVGDALQTVGAGVTKIADDMERAAELTIVSRHLDDAQKNATQFSVNAKGNSGVFEEAWKNYSKETLKRVPPRYRAEIESKLIDLGGNTRDRIYMEDADRTGRVALDAIDARLGTLKIEMADLARTGRTGSEDFRVRRAEADDLIREKTENRLISYSPERAAAERESLEDTMLAEAVTGTLEDTYARSGLGAAQKRAKEILEDESDGLDRAKKIKAVREGLKSIDALDRTDVERRRQFTYDREAVIGELKDGTRDPDDPLIDQMLETADAIRDPVGKRLLISAREVSRFNPMSGVALGDRLDYLRRLRRIETGGAPNAATAANPNSSALGADQFIDSTWLDVLKRNRPDVAAGKSDAELLDLRKDEKLSGEMALALAKENTDALRSAGIQITPSTTYLAHFLGATGAQKLIHAPPDTPVDRILDAEAIAANKEVLDGKTAGEVRAWAQRKMEGAVRAETYVKGVIPAMKKHITEGLNDAIAGAETMLSRDEALDERTLNDLVDAARIVNDAGTTEKVRKIIVRAATVSNLTIPEFAGMPGATGPQPIDSAGLITRLRAPGALGDEALRLAALDQAEATQARIAKTLVEDPRALGVQMRLFGDGAPVTAATIAQMPQVLTSRVPQMKTLAAIERTGPLTVLRPNEAKDLGNVIARGDAAGVYTSLLALDTDHLMATIGTPALADAISGASRSTDPKRFGDAMTFLDTVWARSPMEAERMFGKDVVNNLQDWQATLRYSNAEELQKAIAARSDPQFHQRREKIEEKGRTLARNENVESLLSEFNRPGPFNDPRMPVDEITRDTFLSDYEALFAQRYAATLDAGVARSQAIERLQNLWSRSNVNGGRLTLYAPETLYRSINGTHDWMTTQFKTEVQQRLGFVPVDYAFVPDRITESQIDAGQPPSYLVVGVDEDGRTGMVSDPAGGLLRYSWGRDAALTIARKDFLAKRAGQRKLEDTPMPTRQPFDWMQGYQQ